MVYRLPDKGDPSDEKQIFPQFSLQLLCCRYWRLKHWEFGELSYPYWRIYWNPHPGASIIHSGKIIELNENKIIIIAPNTSYATRLFNNKIPENDYLLEGERITREISEEELNLKEEITHLFMHFNIGIPFDNIEPQIFIISINENRKDKLKMLTSTLKNEYREFDFYSSLVIKSLILDLLAALPEIKWKIISKDSRILNILRFIELNIDEDLSNQMLASETNLATNAFIRLFKNEIGSPPQVYIRKKRIDKACSLLDHSEDSIDIIAEKTGFADRYHFSKTFKTVTGTSPAKYRKKLNV